MNIYEVIDIGYATAARPHWLQWLASKLGRGETHDLSHSKVEIVTFLGKKYRKSYLAHEVENAS